MSQSLTAHLIVPVVSADDAYATTRSLREYPYSEVTVVHNAKHMNLFRQISVNTIENPQQLVAGYLYRAVTRPAIVDYTEVGDGAEVSEITVAEDAPLVGKTLTEAGKANLLPDDVLIVVVERESQDESRRNTRIKANNLLTVHSATGAEPELTDIFGHCEDQTVWVRTE